MAFNTFLPMVVASKKPENDFLLPDLFFFCRSTVHTPGSLKGSLPPYKFSVLI